MSMFWYCVVESSVKYSYLWGSWNGFLAGVNAHKICGYMQGSKPCTFLNCAKHTFINKDTFREFTATMYDAMANGLNFCKAANNAIIFAGELFYNCVYCLGMSGEGDAAVEYGFAVCNGCVLQIAINSDAVTYTFGDD